MKSYVLTGLAQDQLRSLKNAGVTYFKWKDNGVLIPDEETLRLALKTLQAEGIENATDMEGVFTVALIFTDAAVIYPPLVQEDLVQSTADLVDPRASDTHDLLVEIETAIDPFRRAQPEPIAQLDQQIVREPTAERQTVGPLPSPASLPVPVQPTDSKLARLATNPDWLASRVRYIAACAARVHEIVLAAKQRLMAKRSELPSAEERFAKLTRQVAFRPNTVTREELSEKFAQEISQLREIPKVSHVRVTNAGGAILIYTDILCATAIDSEEKHEIGKFLIRILPDVSSDSILFYNATRRVNGLYPAMNAPYVLADGTIISDEIKQTFLDLIARCDFAALADLAIQFIETVNDDAPGRFITRWPGTDLTSFPVN